MTTTTTLHEDCAARRRRVTDDELVALLDSYARPPLITWTVGNASSTPVRRVGAFRPPAGLRRVFGDWHEALAPSHTEARHGGTTSSRTGDRNTVRVRLLATMFDQDTDTKGTR